MGDRACLQDGCGGNRGGGSRGGNIEREVQTLIRLPRGEGGREGAKWAFRGRWRKKRNEGNRKEKKVFLCSRLVRSLFRHRPHVGGRPNGILPFLTPPNFRCSHHPARRERRGREKTDIPHSFIFSVHRTLLPRWYRVGRRNGGRRRGVKKLHSSSSYKLYLARPG